MKIGILTYHRANNVGALLQNYALIKAFESLGCHAETIDYRCKFIERQNRLLAFRSAKEFIKIILQLPYFLRREIKFCGFRNSYIKCSGRAYNSKDIALSVPLYDMFVSGSDQVWNLNLSNGDYTYLLDFALDRKKCVSYAGSFGYSQIPTEYKNKTLQDLSRFSFLSVRESSAKELLAKNGIDSELVLDPTLLLDGDYWIKQFGLKYSPKQRYIFVYMVAYVPELLAAARVKAKEFGCELWVMHYNYRAFPNCKNIRSASPIHFLEYIYNAACVFCSSFHAMCFSVLLHKKFYYGLEACKDNNNSRLETLASALNLSNRNVRYLESVDLDIDYSSVYAKLANMREKSFDYLAKIIKS